MNTTAQDQPDQILGKVVETIGPFEIAYAAIQIRVMGMPNLLFSPIQSNFLALLLSQANTFVSKKEIRERVWHSTDGPSSHVIETHVWRLRQKLEDVQNISIVTRSSGYGIFLTS